MKKDFPIGNWFPANFLGGSRKESERSSLDNSNSNGNLFAFKVVDDGDGTVSVIAGTVNTETATALTPSGKPEELWLEVTFDTDGEVTAASVETSSGSASETKDYRLIAFITWDGNSPTIIQNMGGGQSIGSCGTMHQWTAIYYPSY
jgi:hypothetical protein